MSNMKRINQLIDEFEQNTRTLIEINHHQQAILAELKKALQPEQEATIEKTEASALSIEDVRKVLAQKAADGFKKEVRELLNAYDAEKLTQLKPEHYAAVIEEAGGIGND